VTTGKVHDAKVMANLIREDDAAVYGDKGYASEEKKRAAEAAGVLWAVKEKAKPGRDLKNTRQTETKTRTFSISSRVWRSAYLLGARIRKREFGEAIYGESD
jgi:IS5 family transposase